MAAILFMVCIRRCILWVGAEGSDGFPQKVSGFPKLGKDGIPGAVPAALPVFWVFQLAPSLQCMPVRQATAADPGIIVTSRAFSISVVLVLTGLTWTRAYLPFFPAAQRLQSQRLRSFAPLLHRRSSTAFSVYVIASTAGDHDKQHPSTKCTCGQPCRP